ncbi:hypothetical protein FHS16_005355 [Paenibacillus endophyticus]|uniref:DUF2798 domain-containing protein n=1 Tax=Paenibacillus endophyticus TaxID=1294268 RepID=A0A7W5GDN2_9BACL|nr:hypothetical protein [Paenibacillus endophyticus]MBB3155247.1 hypothetical protein [Paenibacillus endophyticus]
MPTTKKENVYFGMMMCVGMVICMTVYNLFTNDLIGKISWIGIVVQLLLGFAVAFLLELFIVGPIAKKLAFSLPYDKSKKLFVILSLTFFMVIGMVLCMSAYGLLNAYLANGLGGQSLFESYLSIVFKNVIFAFPLQLIIIGPLVRYAFVKFIKAKAIANPLSLKV